ncbi:MAG TPA: LytTR family DNA-binding domain-containing protein [Burkholderiales bacterium]|nr:LytTR family DNA-binding domain-containing protein [Burkholderiales bacterium]
MPTDFLAPYQRWRRAAETGFWVAVFLVQAVLNSATMLADLRRAGLPNAAWEPAVWEFSSNLVLLALVPAVIAFERRFPLRWETLGRNLAAHLAASVGYSAVHVGAMVLLRKLAYAAMGRGYAFGDWLAQGFYEYLKDVRTYALMLVAVLSYRFVMLRLQGEASLLAAPDEGPPLEPVERPQRFLVRKLRREFLVAAADIEWLQAQGNYVALRVRGHDYLLRSTMAEIESRLDPQRFRRVHRSWIANLDRVAEIEPLDDGDARLKMQDGSLVPCSRRYRAGLGVGPSQPAAVRR